MEDDKLYLGPESPADLEWSQGAKNTRTEKEIDDIINLGTYLDDTFEGETANMDEDHGPQGTSQGDTYWVTESETNQSAPQNGNKPTTDSAQWTSEWSNREQERDAATNRAPQGDTSRSNQKIGPPKGDTVTTERPKRLSGAQRRKLAREMGKVVTPRNKKRPAEQSPLGEGAAKKPPPKNPYLPVTTAPPQISTPTATAPSAPKNQSTQQSGFSKRQRNICCDMVRKKSAVFAKLKEDPEHTAIAINKSDRLGMFSIAESEAVIKMIMNEIIALPKNTTYGNEPFVPKFHWYKRIQSLLVFSCVDVETVNWLSNLNFTKAWMDAKVRIMVERDFSKLILCKTVIQGPERSQADIIKMLSLQNKDINFTRWEIKDLKHTPKGNKVLLLVDVPSLRIMKKNGMKLYFGLSKLLVYVLSPGVENAIDLQEENRRGIIIEKPPQLIENFLPSILDQFKTPSIGPRQAFSSQMSGRFQSPPREPDLRFDPPQKLQQPQQQYRPVRSSANSRAQRRSISPRRSSFDKPTVVGSSSKSQSSSFWRNKSDDRDRYDANVKSQSSSIARDRSDDRGRYDEYDRSRTSRRSRSPPSSRDRYDRPKESAGSSFDRSRNLYEQSKSIDMFSKTSPRNVQNMPRDIRDLRDIQIDARDVQRDIRDVPRDIHDVLGDVQGISSFDRRNLSNSAQFTRSFQTNPNFKPYY